MADIKFSPFVLLIALLGASSTAFTIVTLMFIAFALFCLQQLFTRTFSVSRLAATASCVVWLLTGFAVSDVSTQIGAPYVLFPVLLYAMAEYQARRRVSRFLLAVAAYSGFILTTFVTVQVLTLVFIQAVVLLLDVSRPYTGDVTPSRRSPVLSAAGGAAAGRTVDSRRGDGLRVDPDLVACSSPRRRRSQVLQQEGAAKHAQSRVWSRVLTRWPVHATTWSGYVGIVALLLSQSRYFARDLERRLLVLTVAVSARSAP